MECFRWFRIFFARMELPEGRSYSSAAGRPKKPGFGRFVENLRKKRLKTTLLATIPQGVQERPNEYHIIDELEKQDMINGLKAVTPTYHWFAFIVTMEGEEEKELLLKKGLKIGSVQFRLTNLTVQEVEVKAHWVSLDVSNDQLKKAVEQNGFKVKEGITSIKTKRGNKEIDLGVRAFTVELQEGQTGEDIPERILVEEAEILLRHRYDRKWCNECKTDSHFTKFCKKAKCTICKEEGHHWRSCSFTKETREAKQNLGQEAFPTLEEATNMFKQAKDRRKEEEKEKKKKEIEEWTNQIEDMETEDWNEVETASFTSVKELQKPAIVTRKRSTSARSFSSEEEIDNEKKKDEFLDEYAVQYDDAPSRAEKEKIRRLMEAKYFGRKATKEESKKLFKKMKDVLQELYDQYKEEEEEQEGIQTREGLAAFWSRKMFKAQKDGKWNQNEEKEMEEKLEKGSQKLKMNEEETKALIKEVKEEAQGKLKEYRKQQFKIKFVKKFKKDE